MDQYEKLDKLGEGAHGVVVRARVRRVEEVAQARREERAKEQEEAQRAEQQAVALQVRTGSNQYVPARWQQHTRGGGCPHSLSLRAN